MSEAAPIEPGHEAPFVLEGGGVVLALDEELYPLEAVYGACDLFFGRAFVFLTRKAPRVVSVRLRLKQPPGTPSALTNLAGEFANEALNQTLRLRVGAANARIRECYLAAAFPRDTSRATLDAVLSELEKEQPEKDPLRIAVPWDERAENRSTS